MLYRLVHTIIFAVRIIIATAIVRPTVVTIIVVVAVVWIPGRDLSVVISQAVQYAIVVVIEA